MPRALRFVTMTPRSFLIAAISAVASAAHAVEPITITVDPAPRQTFAGFGAGVGNWSLDYQKLTADERATLSRTLWRDLQMTSIRLWINLNEYAPTPGERATKNFRDRYIDSGLLADARANGVTTLLLAPDNCPTFMKTKRDGGPGDFAIRDDALADYANLIADFIKQIRDETGVTFDATGVQNEPNDIDRIAPTQFPIVVKALRAALDARGLQRVAVIAPEAANVDDIYYDTIDRLKKDADAWRSLGGVAFHSYSMAATDRAADSLDGKSFWQTEASANGPESPGDALRATSLAARFLSDMNRRVTHWQHFLGFESIDPNDNATRILAYTPSPLRVTTFAKYGYYKQLAEAFDVGCVFRKSASDVDGAMTWTYGKKPRVTATAARNADGTWSIGVANFTAPTFDERVERHDTFDDGHAASPFAVTIVVPELAAAGDVPFTLHRSSATLANAAEGEAVMHAGRLTLPTVGPLELLTARSR